MTGPLGVAFILAFAGAMMGAGFMLVALVAARVPHTAPAADHEAEMATVFHEPGTLEGVETKGHVVDAPSLLPPPIERKVPVFPARFLEGCSSADLDTIERSLRSAIARGAPMYNEGDIEACADVYETATRELQAALPASCRGPVRALREGSVAASAAQGASASVRAWALRDTFDGLIEIMDRSKTSGVSNL